MEEFFKMLHHSDYFTQFVLLFVIVGGITFFVLFGLPYLGKFLVRGIDGVFGGDKPPKPYKYKAEDLYQWPPHWNNWRKTGTYKPKSDDSSN